jgi:hypothetical protein
MAKRRQAVHPTGRKLPTKPKRALADVDLKKEIAALRLELAEALERQTAASEVLQVISSSPVFEKMLESAARVCGGKFGIMVLLNALPRPSRTAMLRFARSAIVRVVTPNRSASA